MPTPLITPPTPQLPQTPQVPGMMQTTSTIAPPASTAPGTGAGGSPLIYRAGVPAAQVVVPKVSDELARITARGSPLIEQARNNAVKAASARGLQNSTMAAAAGEEAAIAQALPIAQQDAGYVQELDRLGYTMAGNMQGRYGEHVQSIQSSAAAQIAAIASASGIDSSTKQALIAGISAQRDADLAFAGALYEQLPAWDPGWTLLGGAARAPTAGGDGSGGAGTGSPTFPTIPAGSTGGGAGSDTGVGTGGSVGIGGAVGAAGGLINQYLQNRPSTPTTDTSGQAAGSGDGSSGGLPPTPPGGSQALQALLGGTSAGASSAGALTGGVFGPSGVTGGGVLPPAFMTGGAAVPVAGGVFGSAGVAGGGVLPPAFMTGGAGAGTGAGITGAAAGSGGASTAGMSTLAGAGLAAAFAAPIVLGIFGSFGRTSAAKEAFQPWLAHVAAQPVGQYTPPGGADVEAITEVMGDNDRLRGAITSSGAVVGRKFTDPRDGQDYVVIGADDPRASAGTSRAFGAVLRLADGHVGGWAPGTGFTDQTGQMLAQRGRDQKEITIDAAASGNSKAMASITPQSSLWDYLVAQYGPGFNPVVEGYGSAEQLKRTPLSQYLAQQRASDRGE